MKKLTYLDFVFVAILACAALAQTALAAPSAEEERVKVDAIKEKYWARGDDSELGVVQNRLYTKAGKFEFGLLGGVLATDPFLAVKNYGGSVGWHLSEYFSLHFVGWKSSVSPSSALLTFQRTLSATANTNEPRSFLGGELSASVLYGKLSLLGKMIIYYDLHGLGGAGVTNTESGKYFTPYAGIGQQIYLSRMFSLKVDYRLMAYHENIIEKVIPQKLGQVVDERTNWTNSVTVGFSILLGGGKEQ